MIARSEWNPEQANPAAFTAHSESGHSLIFDTSNAHADGLSPVETVLMALCSCTSVDVVGILQKKRQPLAGLTVTAHAERRAEHPRSFTTIRLIYRVRGILSRKAVEDAVALSKNKYCSVSAMLSGNADIHAEIELPDGEQP